MLKINDLERHHAPLCEDLARIASRVLSSGRYVFGPYGEAFEKAFAEFCGTTHVVGVGNGTDALELSLVALDVGPGDEVITVSNAGMYASSAIVKVGATPVFVDVKADEMTMDPERLDGAFAPRTRALVLTHLYGRLADVDAVTAAARSRGIPVIEDCAQAHGATMNGRRSGSFGALGCFSFYPTKNLGACGDAGAVTTSDTHLAGRLRALRQYGWSQKYEAVHPGGRNTRLDELQAAFLLEKLPFLARWNERRVWIARRYGESIRHPLIRVPSVEPGEHVAHLYVVQCPDREQLRAHLHTHGIAAEVHYPVPDHLQPALQGRVRAGELPVTERLAREVLSLPCFPEMTDVEIEQVILACNTWDP